MKNRLWTASEMATAARIWKQMASRDREGILSAIARKLGRTYSSVHARYYIFGASFCDPEGPAASAARAQRRTKRRARTVAGLAAIVEREHGPPPAVVAERDARLSLSPRDNTAFLMGDPLPGCSALERRA